MKRILYPLFLLFVFASFVYAQPSGQRIFGAQQFQLDDNVPADAKVYLTTNTGSLGIDNTGSVTPGVFPSVCAILDLSSTTKGFLPPRVTTAQEALICGGTPNEGLVVYNLTTHQLDLFGPFGWGAVGWALNGNLLTGGSSSAPNQYFGSNNNYDVVVKTNSIERLRIGSSNAANVATITTPSTATTGLRVAGNAATVNGVSVDMSANNVTTANATTFNGTITGTGGTNVNGANLSATASSAGNATGLTSTSLVTNSTGTSSAVTANASSSGTASGKVFGVNASATSAASFDVEGISATATETGPGVFGSVIAGNFYSTGAPNTDITFGLQSFASATGGFQALGISTGAAGANNNTAVVAAASGLTGTNTGVEVQVSGTNSVGMRVGNFWTPTTGISIVSATNAGISISGVPLSITATGNIQTTGNNNTFGNSSATNNILVVNGSADATIASTAANNVWDSRINGDQLVTGVQKIGGSIWLDGTSATHSIVTDAPTNIGTKNGSTLSLITNGSPRLTIDASGNQTVSGNMTVNGTLTVGGGTTITNSYRTSFVLGSESGLLGGTSDTYTLSMNVNVGDAIIVSWPDAIASSDNFILKSWIAGTNTVKLSVYNAGVIIHSWPNSTVYITVLRY